MRPRDTEQTAFAELEGCRVAYEWRGGGEKAIVFVHGWSVGRWSWHRQMDGLDSDRRLVALDLPGHGESDKPDARYTMDLLARSVAAVMDALSIRRAMLVGHSNGVPVVRQLYRLQPDRVEALVAVDGPLRPVLPKERAEWMRAALQRPDYEDFLKRLAGETPAGELAPADLARIQEDALATPRDVMVGGLDALSDPAIWREDPIEVPLLAVHATNPHVPTWTDDYRTFVGRLAPRVEYHVWKGASHFLALERPAGFNRLLERFVARVESGEI